MQPKLSGVTSLPPTFLPYVTLRASLLASCLVPPCPVPKPPLPSPPRPATAAECCGPRSLCERSRVMISLSGFRSLTSGSLQSALLTVHTTETGGRFQSWSWFPNKATLTVCPGFLGFVKPHQYKPLRTARHLSLADLICLPLPNVMHCARHSRFEGTWGPSAYLV